MSLEHRLARAEDEEIRLLASDNRARRDRLAAEFDAEYKTLRATVSADEALAHYRANRASIAEGYVEALAAGSPHPWVEDLTDYIGLEEELADEEHMYREWLADPEGWIANGGTLRRATAAGGQNGHG